MNIRSQFATLSNLDRQSWISLSSIFPNETSRQWYVPLRLKKCLDSVKSTFVHARRRIWHFLRRDNRRSPATNWLLGFSPFPVPSCQSLRVKFNLARIRRREKCRVKRPTDPCRPVSTRKRALSTSQIDVSLESRSRCLRTETKRQRWRGAIADWRKGKWSFVKVAQF